MHTHLQVLNHINEDGSVTKYDGLDQGIINMGHGLLFTQELLREFLEHASKNQMTMKGYFNGKVQAWRDNLFGCEGAHKHICT
jgi:hypothetical protein